MPPSVTPPSSSPSGPQALPSFAEAHRQSAHWQQAISNVVVGQPLAIKRIVAALLARGHVLLEDVPGVGKTTLARSVAKIVGAQFVRIQFTSDLLPSDILGVQVLAPDGRLEFRRGPLFSEFVLADEINRASPKAQSAMLEAMAERRISVEDCTYDLPKTFTVLATQNPTEQHGVYPLPESQLDRFLLRTQLGYPQAADETKLLLTPHAPEAALSALTPACDADGLWALQRVAADVHLAPDVADYIVRLAHASRHHPMVRLGLSPRATLAMAQAARAWALLSGREYVSVDDVQALSPVVFVHRLRLAEGAHGLAIVDDLLGDVAVPR